MTILASIEQLSNCYWEKPLRRLSPVTIGGILAWIIRVDRNEKAFDNGSALEQSKILNRVRKIVQKRDRISRQRKSESVEQQTGKPRRIL
jgi:hypothetical protein